MGRRLPFRRLPSLSCRTHVILTPARLILTAFLAAALYGQTSSAQRAEWNRAIQPFHIIGNIYYVGPHDVSAFLITTPQGNILLDGGFPESAPIIERNIATLGFKVSEIRYLLNSHAHFDHAGGLAELKRASGAQLIASRGDASTLEDGRGADEPPVKVDRLIGNGQTVQLGGVTLAAAVTPGHTKGCTTWTMPVTENGRTYHVVFYCSTSVVDKLVGNRAYPNIVADYESSFPRLLAMPCDVFLGAHGWFFHLDEKREKAAAGGPNPFIDPAEMHAYVEESRKDFERELAAQSNAQK